MEKEILIGTVPLQGMGVVSPIVSAESPVPSAPPEMTRFMDGEIFWNMINIIKQMSNYH